MIERAVELHLIRRVKALGGEVRKVVWVGRRHAPDRLVLLPGWAAFVELKRPGAVPRPGQSREHARLRASGLPVVTLASRDDVDRWLADA